MTKISKCLLCKSDLPANDALKCPICHSAQTKFDIWKIKNGNFYGVMKVIATAIFIPIVLWWLSSHYASTQQNLANQERQIAEISSITPLLRNSRANLYATCLNMSKPKCIDELSKNIKLFNASVNIVLEKISIHKHDLIPSIILLSTLDVEQDVSNIWNEYFSCLIEIKNEIDCNAERKRHPLIQLEVADFIIDYIECDLQKQIANLQGKNVSNYCAQTISYREKIIKEIPNKIMKNFTGNRLPLEIFDIKNKIIEEYILPGSGLTVTMQDKSQSY